MNKLEEQALIDELRRRGDHLVRAASLSCSVEQYRVAARRGGRKRGWRIRTFLVNDGAAATTTTSSKSSADRTSDPSTAREPKG
jgi:hypothetical protein